MDKIEVLVLTPENKVEFTEKLTRAALDYFDCETVEELPDNYGRKHPWSLLSFIDNDQLDIYQILYVNDQVWCCAGGIHRVHNGKKVYQGGFRWFSNAEKICKGLGSIKSYSHKYLIAHHLERAREQGFEEFILSFNDYNYRMFQSIRKYHLRKVLPDVNFEPSSEMVLFNNTPQWLLTVKLK
jgi:hypothetical protein